MDCEGPSSGVTIHITGFKKFGGLVDNPTESIINKIKPFVEKNGLPKRLVIGSCAVLETAGIGAVGTLYKLLEASRGSSNGGSSNSNQVIWVHLGVYSGICGYLLEEQAVNEADFGCPDELGWEPEKLQIVPSDGPISRVRTTTLPLNEILEELRKMGFDEVAISEDAGRFVCNYVYYQSLRGE